MKNIYEVGGFAGGAAAASGNLGEETLSVYLYWFTSTLSQLTVDVTLHPKDKNKLASSVDALAISKI